MSYEKFENFELCECFAHAAHSRTVAPAGRPESPDFGAAVHKCRPLLAHGLSPQHDGPDHLGTACFCLKWQASSRWRPPLGARTSRRWCFLNPGRVTVFNSIALIPPGPNRCCRSARKTTTAPSGVDPSPHRPHAHGSRLLCLAACMLTPRRAPRQPRGAAGRGGTAELDAG